MTITKQQQQKIGIFGAVAGIATPFLLKYVVVPILGMLSGFVPQISLKLAESNPTINVGILDSLTGINGGLSAWLVEAFGLTVTVPFQTYIMAAVGGAVLFLAGAYLADSMNLLKGKPEEKTRMVIFLGSAIAAFVLGGMAVPSIGIDLVNTMIAFGINAAILAFVYVSIDKSAKIGLIPF